MTFFNGFQPENIIKIITRNMGFQPLIAVSLFFNDEEGHWDISYNLGKKFWSNGYATEAMSAVMKYAVKVMKIKEISTTYAIENSASGYVLQKLGFEFIKEVPYECNGGDIVTMGRYCRYEAR